MPYPDRVQHIGSLIRPPALVEALKPFRASFERNKFESVEQEEHIRAVAKDSIREAVKTQLELELSPVTSGEFERVVYYNGLLETLDGLDMQFVPFQGGIWRPGNMLNIFLEQAGLPGREAYVATSKIKRTKPAYADEWQFLKSCLPEEKHAHAKITILSPLWWHQFLLQPYTAESGYQNDDEYLTDIVQAVREELLELYDQGLRHVQIDDPVLVWLHSDQCRPFLQENNTDMNDLMDLYMKYLKLLTQDLPTDLVMYHHMCRGNAPGDPMPITGDYEAVAKRLFKETDFNQFLMEHITDEKHGNFEFLQHLGKNQVIVIGLISTKFAELEDLATLKARVLEAASVVAKAHGRSVQDVLRNNIAVSPQCGFSSSMDYSAMSLERQWEKIKLLKRLVAEVWPAEE